MISRPVLRVALIIGAAILALFFQQAMGPLLDVPVKDPSATTFAGGEFLVVALLYVVVFRDVDRYRALLALLVLDQILAFVLPGAELLRGHLPATVKILAPMPFSAALAVIYLLGLRRPT